MDEIWKPIDGYEGYYEISSCGRVKTVERKVYNPGVLGDGCYRTVPEIIRKPNIMKGYHCIALRKDNKVKVFRIHRLVIEHFAEKQPSKEHQVNHIDGDKSNNCIENLEWVTPLENTEHAFKTGLRKRHPTEETLCKMSKASAERWKDKEYRSFQKRMMKEVWEKRKAKGWKSWKIQN
jgi:hypothetical protein